MTLKNGMSQVPISPDSPYSNKSVLTHSSLLDSFPSSQAFDAINDVLTANEAEQKDAVKKGGAIFTFNLKNSQGQEEAWYLDLKESGTVGKGAAPAGKKSDVTLSLSDEDFGKLVAGKTKPEPLFMSGKLKIKGNMMKATKMQPILAKARAQAKL